MLGLCGLLVGLVFTGGPSDALALRPEYHEHMAPLAKVSFLTTNGESAAKKIPAICLKTLFAGVSISDSQPKLSRSEAGTL